MSANKFFEMHKHTVFSIFDGFGSLAQIVKYAEELGYTAMGISDHGNASGVAKLYFECMKHGIKPILGTEAYFKPTFKKTKGRYHMCIYAKNFNGYQNMMQLLTEAETKNFYYKGHVTLPLLNEYGEDIIVTSGCMAGYIPQAILKGQKEQALRMAQEMKKLFGDDFYLEIMPFPVFIREEDDYKIPSKYKGDIQRFLNDRMLSLGKHLNIKCIPTTDSHYTRPEDWPSYHTMHKMNGTKYDVKATYHGRHMQSEKGILKAMKNHGISKDDAFEMLDNLQELQTKIVDDIFEGHPFDESVPEYDDGSGRESQEILIERCKKYLKETGRYNKKYIDRTKLEAKVLKIQNINDYFLIVADYVMYAHDIDCYVGPGRGSVCGSLIAELLGITDVDPVEIGNDFERFLRADKKKMPDIDLDFENGKREKVIEYLLEKYEGSSAQVLTFGFYKTKFLANDLVKFYEMDEVDSAIFKRRLGKLIDDKAHFNFEGVDIEKLMNDLDLRRLNEDYIDEYGVGPVEHFVKLYGSIRYKGTHAAGVVITKGPIGKWVGLLKTKSGYSTCFDKYDIEDLGMLKFDILGLKTLNVMHDIEDEVGYRFHRTKMTKEDSDLIYKAFREGKTTGIFQSGSNMAKDIYQTIQCDGIQDLIAGISLNRPGPLSLHMHTHYADNKANPETDTKWYEYTSDTNGTIIYQEHVMRICYGLAKMEPDDVDKLMKFKFDDEMKEILRKKFISGCVEHSDMDPTEAEELFNSMTLYLFNKGHGSGYAIISEHQMFHKVRYPIEYYWASLKYVYDVGKEWELKREAVSAGDCVIFLAHVNYTAEYSIRTEDGDRIIQEGLRCIKGVGEKGAIQIEKEKLKNGPFKSKQDFIDRCRSRSITKATIEALDKYGALEFSKKRYISRVIKFNSTLYR